MIVLDQVLNTRPQFHLHPLNLLPSAYSALLDRLEQPFIMLPPRAPFLLLAQPLPILRFPLVPDFFDLRFDVSASPFKRHRDPA